MSRTFALVVATLAALTVAAGCGGDGTMMTDPSRMGPGAGVGPAAFMSVSPSGGAAGVSVSTSVVIRFGAAMGPGMEQYVDLHVGDLAGPVVPMSCAWSGDGATLTCTPSAPLQPRTTYWVHVGGGMTTRTGQPVDYDGYGPMMGGAWRHANGAYGMAFPFTTA